MKRDVLIEIEAGSFGVGGKYSPVSEMVVSIIIYHPPTILVGFIPLYYTPPSVLQLFVLESSVQPRLCLLPAAPPALLRFASISCQLLGTLSPNGDSLSQAHPNERLVCGIWT